MNGGVHLVTFSLLIGIVPVILIIFAITIVGKNKSKGDDTVFRSLYTYLVLFATLMMVIGGGISIFMAAADLVSPTAYYQSYSDYRQMRLSDKEGNIDTNLTEEEMRTEYDQLQSDEKQRQQQNAKNQIIKSLGFIIIPLPIFIFFNRRRKTEVD